MKKIYFILAAAAMFLAVDANAQLGVGIGYNLLNTTQRLGDETDDDSDDTLYLQILSSTRRVAQAEQFYVDYWRPCQWKIIRNKAL